jgi:4a-hydroxytetrahydrobiopterin dehydratase
LRRSKALGKARSVTSRSSWCLPNSGERGILSPDEARTQYSDKTPQWVPWWPGVEGGIGMTSVLAEKTCTPCRGGTPPLTVEEAEAYRVQAPEWLLRDETTRIERTDRFRNFGDAFAFVRSAGNLPKQNFIILISALDGAMLPSRCAPKRSEVWYENDFIMAVKLDRLAGEISTPDNQASNSGGHRMPDSAY